VSKEVHHCMHQESSPVEPYLVEPNDLALDKPSGDGLMTRTGAATGTTEPETDDIEELKRRVRVLQMENDVLRRIASFHAGREISPSEVALEMMTAERRAPFAENPTVGERGTKTQQRIVRAAMQVFNEVDYRSCSIEQISEVAGCSRSSFYQYFSSKDDLFRRVARELSRSLYVITEGSERITSGPDGREAIRFWLDRFGALFDEYAPMFDTFDTVAGLDSEVAERGQRVTLRQAEMLAERFSDEAFEGTDRTMALARLVQAIIRAYRSWNQLSEAAETPGIDRERLHESMTNVIHRIAFGVVPEVNLGQEAFTVPAFERPPLADLVRPREPVARQQLSRAGLRTRRRLIEAGREVFMELGFHATRVDDVVLAAGSSHGTFYRYFDGKHDLFRTIAYRSGQRLAQSVEEIPDFETVTESADRSRVLRAWVENHVSISLENAPISQEWIDASAGDPELRAVSMEALEWFRRRLAWFLAPRGFGDVDTDALILVALLLHAVRHRLPADKQSETVDMVVMMLQRGFLGHQELS
jgi:AcrR family transcriptional regulator